MHKYEHLKDIPLFSTFIVLLFGLWGAILNYRKHKYNKTKLSFLQKMTMFIIDLLTSSGLSILTFYACMGYGVGEVESVAIAGAVAYNGTNIVYYFELALANKFGGDKVVEVIEREQNNDIKK